MQHPAEIYITLIHAKIYIHFSTSLQEKVIFIE